MYIPPYIYLPLVPVGMWPNNNNNFYYYYYYTLNYVLNVMKFSLPKKLANCYQNGGGSEIFVRKLCEGVHSSIAITMKTKGFSDQC